MSKDSEQGSFTIFSYEKQRITSKGLSIIPGILLASLYFFILPSIIHDFYSYLPYNNPTFMNFSLTMLLSLISMASLNIFYYILYIGKYKLFECYRVSLTPWPWETDKKAFTKNLKKIFLLVSFNQLIIGPLIAYLSLLFSGVNIKLSHEDFPTNWVILIHIGFFIIVEDFVNYWCHRFLHHPFMYKRFHKQHHENIMTYSFAGVYSHPVEYVLSGLLPTSIGPIILGQQCHIITLYLWVIMRNCESVDGHSAYEIPWNPLRILPFSAGAEYHSYHHSHNIGNYGSFLTLWDSFCGTNKSFLSFKKKAI